MSSCAAVGEPKCLDNNSSIIWKDESASMLLIDIPRSIEEAQYVHRPRQGHRILRSSEPLQEPFPSNEPKSAKSKNTLRHDKSYEDLHASYVELIQTALDSIRSSHVGQWCFRRPFVSVHPRKRRHEESSDHSQEDLPLHVLNKLAACVETQHLHNLPGLTRYNALVCNEGVSPAVFESLDHGFLIPPKSSFVLSDCENSDAFRVAIRNQAQENNSKRSFDLMIFDPPWPNRSVRRTHKTSGSTYSIASAVHELRDLILGTDLDMLMHAETVVGFWITNKPIERDMILGPEGTFALWDIELCEEWVWLKTTVHGEPVVSPDSLWRKPYEILLLGRRKSRTCENHGSSDRPPVKRRVIAGVPDLHSRKPCLKSLFEHVFFTRTTEYRALEVFSRNLVAGWWSWGNECIKFNWNGYWREDKDISIVNS